MSLRQTKWVGNSKYIIVVRGDLYWYYVARKKTEQYAKTATLWLGALFWSEMKSYGVT